MVISREDNKWSPCLDKNVFQFSGTKHGDGYKTTWFYTAHSRNHGASSSVFGCLSDVLEYLTFLKRK